MRIDGSREIRPPPQRTERRDVVRFSLGEVCHISRALVRHSPPMISFGRRNITRQYSELVCRHWTAYTMRLPRFPTPVAPDDRGGNGGFKCIRLAGHARPVEGLPREGDALRGDGGSLQSQERPLACSYSGPAEEPSGAGHEALDQWAAKSLGGRRPSTIPNSRRSTSAPPATPGSRSRLIRRCRSRRRALLRRSPLDDRPAPLSRPGRDETSDVGDPPPPTHPPRVHPWYCNVAQMA